MRSLCATALCLGLSACGGVNLGDSTEYPAPPEAGVGLGFDSLSGLTRGACVERKPVRKVMGGARTVQQVFYARNRQQIAREIGYSGGVSFGLAGFGLELGLESLDRQSLATTTTFAVIHIRVEAPSRTLEDYRLQDHARDTLRRDGSSAFYEKCGDGFVSAVRSGGMFLGIVALEEVTKEEGERLSGKAGLSIFGFGVGGGASRESEQFLSRHRARYFVIQEGGASRGPNSVKELSSISALLARANLFQATLAGLEVPARIVVRPYQVTSNRPRRRELLNLRTQRRVLGRLAVEYGELERAVAELDERLRGPACAKGRAQRRAEKLLARYQAAVSEVAERAQECLNDPQSACSERGLIFVEPDALRDALAVCETPAQVSVAPPSPPSPPPPQIKGVDVPCRLWQLDRIAVQVASRKPNGADWDGDGSPPELSISIAVDQRNAARFPARETYTRSEELAGLHVKSGAAVQVYLTDSDAFFDDGIARISGRVPETLESGAWRLEAGETSAVFDARCVE